MKAMLRGVSLALCAAAAAGFEAEPPTIWPAPASARSGSGTAYMNFPGGGDAGAFFSTNLNNSAFLSAAFARYGALVFPHAIGSLEVDDAETFPDDDWQMVWGLKISVDDADDSHPQFGLDES